MTHDWLFGPSTVTLANGVAVPETVGVVVAVPLLVGETMATVGGAKAVSVVGTLVLPPGPLAVTVNGVTPAVTLTGQANVPDVAVVLHKVAPLGLVMVITLPGVALPDTIWVSGPGALGATVRLGGEATVKLVTAGVEVPPGLVETAVAEFVPVGNGVAVVTV